MNPHLKLALHVIALALLGFSNIELARELQRAHRQTEEAVGALVKWQNVAHKWEQLSTQNEQSFARQIEETRTVMKMVQDCKEIVSK